MALLVLDRNYIKFITAVFTGVEGNRQRREYN